MNPRPASTRLRRVLPLVVALAIGAAAGAGAYALTNHNSSTTPSAAAPLVVPAQRASSTSTVDSLTEIYKQDAPGVVDIAVQLASNAGASSGGFPFSNPGGGSQKAEAE